MVPQISLADFVRTGVFGPIRSASPIDVTRDFLGEPEDVGRIGRGVNRCLIWRYAAGRLEVTFVREETVLIAWYRKRGRELSNIRIVDALPKGVSDSARVFTQWLEQDGITFKSLTDDAGIYLVEVPGGASAAFDGDELDSLQASGG